MSFLKLEIEKEMKKKKTMKKKKRKKKKEGPYHPTSLVGLPRVDDLHQIPLKI